MSDTPMVIYAIKPNGDLQWYRHDGWQDGSGAWTAGGGGVTVNSGWEIYSTVLCGYDGVMYGIKPNGDMHWFRHQGWREGTNAWAGGPSGIKVGTGWQSYATVLHGPGDVIYAITPTGDMQWYRHDGSQTGSQEWTAGGGGIRVGTGWNSYSTVFFGSSAHIGGYADPDIPRMLYAVTPNGDLQWYRHDGWQDGGQEWTAGGGGKKVATGWTYGQSFGGYFGVLYGIRPNGDLQWYRHDGFRDGSPQWTAGGGGKTVGTGWNSYTKVFS
ncbi:hypothetical protein RW1_022_00540 [Rhodococcus wratislaviensis NBRC 100605]|uniref:Tachylectin 2 domain-containing protein n=1 Tax=Rhodococcus wratislaviensis NBRC 100605 TaxID=1219028 RepID=X0Q371_RHOWR|nr:hypothetical protein RW1_022_00540 [Rhodococcus wratislaviensis NBRC 100605]